MNFPTTLLSLFARTLANNLYKLPTKLISLKSFKSSAPPFFGIKTKKVAFKLLSNCPRSKNSLKKPNTSPLTKSQQRCQKPMVNPSDLKLYPHSKLIELKRLPPQRKDAPNSSPPPKAKTQKTIH